MLDEALEIVPLDLLDAARTPQLRSQLMESMSDRIMRQIGFALFQRMRHSVQLLSCINGVISHETALSSLPDVMIAGVADLLPLRGKMIVAVEGELIGAVVDGMCGATTADYFERSELSSMETRVGKQMVELTFGTLSEVLSTLIPLNLKVEQYETSTGMLAIADGQDWMISTTGLFETPLGIGAIKLIAPYTGFEPLEAVITSQAGMMGSRSTDAPWAGVLNRLAEQTRLELRFEIAQTHIPIGMFEALRIGQILPLHLMEHAAAKCGDIELFHGEYGQSGNHVCCRPISIDPKTGDIAMSDQAEIDKDIADIDRVTLEHLLPQPRATFAVAGSGAVERVPVLLTVELGRTSLSVKELRQLRHGQVVILDQIVGDPLGIFANGHRLAAGEVVAVAKDQYGIRVTGLVEDAEPGNEAKA